MRQASTVWHPLAWGGFLFLLTLNPLQAQHWRDFKVKTGDDLQFAEPQFDDGNWQTYEQWRGTEAGRTYKGNLWLRGRLTFENHAEGVNFAMGVVALATCEVYLDGQLIAANGRVGTGPQDELPGQTIFVLAIPPQLHTAGPSSIGPPLFQPPGQLSLRYHGHGLCRA